MSWSDQSTAVGLSPSSCENDGDPRFLRLFSSNFRYFASGCVLWVAILIAPALTIRNLTVHTNSYIGWLQWVFVALMAPELARSVRSSLADSLTFRVLVIGFLVCMVGWLTQGLPLEMIDRTWFYAVQPLFVLAAVAWFRWAGDRGLRSLYWAKLAATAGAVFYLFVMLSLSNVSDLDLRNVRPLPIYRHIRHLGYDLAVVASLGAVFWGAKPNAHRLWNWMLFMALGYVSLRTGGRGQMMNFFAFVLIAACLLRRVEGRIVLLQALIAFALGAVMLYLTQPEAVAWFFGKAVGGSAAGVTSGRTEIWIKVLNLVSSDWLSLLVGLGPEGFARERVVPGLVQAHNAGVQILLEFGLVGVGAIIIALLDLGRKIWPMPHEGRSSDVLNGAVAALLALLLYSLVDGIFYHASPFLAAMLLIAFVLSKRVANGSMPGG
ncbi:MAG: hypothetical protein J0M28_07225 [Thauera sp.]|nr:hypothetical protein [Thauera sp.]